MGWWKHAKAGDKVVCVKLGYHFLWRQILEVNRVYTITEVVLSDDQNEEDPAYLGLQEVVENMDFSVLAFRPVQSKSTEAGMAILRKILKTKKQDA